MNSERQSRQPIDQYFMEIAKLVATRSTCNRRRVGCVITRDKRIIATGYNGSLPGAPHCSDGHCLLHEDSIHGETCVRTTHAETNAILQAARFGTSLDGTLAYVTVYPCYRCLMNLIISGVKQVVYDEDYVDAYNHEMKEILVRRIV